MSPDRARSELRRLAEMAPLVVTGIVKAVVTGEIPQPETQRLNELSAEGRRNRANMQRED